MIHQSSASTSATGARQPISSKQRIRIYKVLFSLAAVLVGLVIAEAALRLVERIQVGDQAIEGKLIKDPVLGFKLAPYSQGHDANGFGNETSTATS